MKRALLIVGGTLGGLGAVMAITPPQLNSSGNLAISGAGAVGGAGAIGAAVATNPTPTAATSIQPTPTKSSTKSVVTKTTKTKRTTSKAVATKKTGASASTATNPSNSTPGAVAANPAPTATKTVAPTPVATKTIAPAPASKGVTGTFDGPAIFVNYGTVQVQLTIKDGRITDATALQAPTGRNSRYTDMALPILKKQTLAAQSANIQGASGASYTSYGWYTSLQGALAKAGL